MKKIFFILITLTFHFLCYSREIDFDYEYHNNEKYIINEKIKVTNKTEKNVNFSIYGRLYSRGDNPLKKIVDISSPAKARNKVYALEDGTIEKRKYEFIKILSENDSVTFEIIPKGDHFNPKEDFLNIIIVDMPTTFEQIQKYPRYSHGVSDEFCVKIDENITYKFNCLYFRCQKNNYSELFNRYICFYDYELGKGEKGFPEYIKYKYTLICMACFTEEQIKAIEEKGKQLYKLNEEQKKRLKENIELNKDNLSYHMADYPRISTFSRNSEIGKKYIADRLNYYDVSYMGNNNYDVRGTYSRAVFHCPTGIIHFSMSDYQRIITYLGNIDVVRNDGAVLSVPYYECSDKLESIDSDIEVLVKRDGDWQREIELTKEVREILNKY